jgi:hypothetical protein
MCLRVVCRQAEEGTDIGRDGAVAHECEKTEFVGAHIQHGAVVRIRYAVIRRHFSDLWPARKRSVLQQRVRALLGMQTDEGGGGRGRRGGEEEV